MNIKEFSFPTFEKWNQTQKYEEKIGTYTCAIRAFSYGCNGNTQNVYVAAISPDDNPLNIYSRKDVCDSIKCDNFDERRLKEWYDEVTSNFNKKWEEFLLKTYFKE